MTDLIAESARMRPSIAATAPDRPPQSARPVTNAAHPQHVEQRRTGRTAFPRTLAFFARS
ncbi:MAG: hypothetical protein IKB76_00255 [Kiritimatiellae bacterium]|nr:hypothetical protein [Kiritimatiellia bacterium]